MGAVGGPLPPADSSNVMPNVAPHDRHSYQSVSSPSIVRSAGPAHLRHVAIAAFTPPAMARVYTYIANPLRKCIKGGICKMLPTRPARAKNDSMPSTEKEFFKDKIEVSLDGRQIFYLFFGGAVIASMVFILGVVVGKRVEARSHADQQSTAAVTRDPLAALDQLGKGSDKLSFPSALGDPNSANKPLGNVDRAWQQKRDKVAAAKRERDAKLDADSASGDKADDNANGVAAAKANNKPTGDKAKNDTVKKAKGNKAKADKPTRKLPKYTLQLSSFQERMEADAFFQKLTDAGYTPYIVAANVKGKGTWYRVRLGSFMGYDEAIRAKKDFEAGQNIIAYVTRLRRKKR